MEARTDAVPLGASPLRDRPHPMDDLTWEVALVYHRLRDAAREVVGQGRHSAGRRSIIRSLHWDGPATSSEMARDRSVSRQHFQKLVDGLRSDGLVALGEDPRDARAKLVRLTGSGRAVYEGMMARERSLLDYLAADLPDAALATAVEVLRSVRRRLDAEEWEELHRNPRPP